MRMFPLVCPKCTSRNCGTIFEPYGRGGGHFSPNKDRQSNAREIQTVPHTSSNIVRWFFHMKTAMCDSRKRNRRWVLKRSLQFPRTWRRMHLVPILASTDCIFAGAEPDGAVTAAVGVDFVAPGTPNLVRSLDAASKEESARHNVTHFPSRRSCGICVASRSRDTCHRTMTAKRDAMFRVIELDYGESWRGRNPHNNVKMFLAVDTSMEMVNGMEALKQLIESMGAFQCRHFASRRRTCDYCDAGSSPRQLADTSPSTRWFPSLRRCISHQSMETVESSIQGRRTQMGTLVFQISTQSVHRTSCRQVSPWTVRH